MQTIVPELNDESIRVPLETYCSITVDKKTYDDMNVQEWKAHDEALNNALHEVIDSIKDNGKGWDISRKVAKYLGENYASCLNKAKNVGNRLESRKAFNDCYFIDVAHKAHDIFGNFGCDTYNSLSLSEDITEIRWEMAGSRPNSKEYAQYYTEKVL